MLAGSCFSELSRDVSGDATIMSSTELQFTDDRTGTPSPSRGSLIAMGDLFGRKWCPVVLYRLLRRGPTGFSELKRDIGGVSGKMLSETLETLDEYDLVERSVISENPLRVSYAPTERGKSLEPVLEDMLEWSAEHLEGA